MRAFVLLLFELIPLVSAPLCLLVPTRQIAKSTAPSLTSPPRLVAGHACLRALVPLALITPYVLALVDASVPQCPSSPRTFLASNHFSSDVALRTPLSLPWVVAIVSSILM